MAAVVQPVVTGGSGGSVPDARNAHGSTTGLAPSAIATLATEAAGDVKIRGFNVHGTTDGLAWIEVNDAPLPGLVARFSRVLPAYIVIPNPEPVLAFAEIKLRVRNEGPAAGDFEGVFFGE